MFNGIAPTNSTKESQQTPAAVKKGNKKPKTNNLEIVSF